MYVIVTVGLAVTLAPVVALKDVLGVQVYVVALPPVSVVDVPEHMVAGPAEAVNVGVAVTVTTSVFGPDAAQPAAEVPFRVYVIVVVGLAVTLEPVLALKLVFGVHV